MFSFLFQNKQKQDTFISSWVKKYIQDSTDKYIQQKINESKYKKVFFDSELVHPSDYHDWLNLTYTNEISFSNSNSDKYIPFYMMYIVPLGFFLFSNYYTKKTNY